MEESKRKVDNKINEFIFISYCPLPLPTLLHNLLPPRPRLLKRRIGPQQGEEEPWKNSLIEFRFLFIAGVLGGEDGEKGG